MNDQERTSWGFFGTTVLILIVVAGAFLLMMILGMFPLHDPVIVNEPSTTGTYPRCATPPSTSFPGTLCTRPDGHLVLVDGYGHVILWK